MTSIFSNLNPVPAVPSYTGPYNVGTQDVEIPVADLPSPAAAPDPSISTISFRIFYPCEQPAKTPSTVYWIPEPQREYMGAYARFLGANPKLSELFAYIPRLLYYIRIPALQGAPLSTPSADSKRWPVLIFSHGLGGTRNAYSHLCGSLASHGVVVIAPEHRDGSCPITFIRDPNGSKAKSVEYHRIPHTHTVEVTDARDEQLRIRLWELGLVYEALLKIDRGESLRNIAAETLQKSKNLLEGGDLSMFASSLDVHTPGSISWAGHSFGAATTIQFVKSVFYQPTSAPSTYKPLYVPGEVSSITQQITPKSCISLLDLWSLPLLSSSTSWLWEKPLPCYSPCGPGGSTVLTILSEAFFKWQANLEKTKRAISELPAEDDHHCTSTTKSSPYIFYPVGSAHLSQSDFGVIFPWTTKRVFKAQEPERTLRLNVRAILEVLRRRGVQVANTSNIDMEEEVAQNEVTREAALDQDKRILATDGSVRGWISLQMDKEDESTDEGSNVFTDEKADPTEAVMKAEVVSV